VSLLGQEIREQFQFVPRFLEWVDGVGQGVAKQLADLAMDAEKPRPITMVGMGASYHCALGIAHRRLIQGHSIRVYHASDLEGVPTSVMAGHVVILISQSGRTAETLALARRLGGNTPLVTITNDILSPMAAMANVVVPLGVGTEPTLSAIRTYAASVLAADWCTLHLFGGFAADWVDRAAAGLRSLEVALPALEEAAEAAAVRLDPCGAIWLLGDGAAYATACQGALLLQEAAAAAAGPGVLAEARHGATEALGPGIGVVAVSPGTGDADLLEQAVAWGSPLWTVATPSAATDATCLIQQVLPLELLADRLGIRRGLQPGGGRRTAKVHQG